MSHTSGEGKVVPVHVMQAYRGAEVYLNSFWPRR